MTLKVGVSSKTEEPKIEAIPLNNFQNGNIIYDTLHSKADRPMGCSTTSCKGSVMNQWKVQNTQGRFLSLESFSLAESFLREFYHEMDRENEFLNRWEQVLSQLIRKGKYDLTSEELEYGVKLAWRNHSRCVARIQWNNLTLFDHRSDVTNADEMFSAICDFVKQTTNGGVIKPSIGVFRPRQYGQHDFRIWNKFMIAYAGYLVEELVPNPDGDGLKRVTRKIGDQGNLEFTQFCQKLGWKGEGTHFDILPIVLSDNGNPKFYNFPEDLVLRVHIKHPTLTILDNLNLQWYALPSVAGMMLEVGGIQYPAAPFGGWYCSIEIVRNILEPNRYNLLQVIADAMGLDQKSNYNLWKDRVAVEVNTAILHSFRIAGVSIVDQHTVSEQFQTHLEDEYQVRGGCPSDWLWLTPSHSGAMTTLFHQEMLHYHLTPSFESQDLLWQAYRFPTDGKKRLFSLKNVCKAICFANRLRKKKMTERPTVNIFYATEMGTSKRYAEKLKQKFVGAFNVNVFQMIEFTSKKSGICLFVTSTFGNGEPPKMAEKLAEWIDKTLSKNEMILNEKMGNERSAKEMNNTSVIASATTKRLFRRMSVLEDTLNTGNLSFAVFALGSSAYPKFCAFGKWLDLALKLLDGTRLVQVGLGDELGDRDGEFNKWAKAVYEKVCLEAGVQAGKLNQAVGDSKVARWKTFSRDNSATGIESVVKDLTVAHKQTIVPATLIGRQDLGSAQYQHVLINLELNATAVQTYQPGDHLAVFPVNSDDDVDFLIKHVMGIPEDPKKSTIQLQEYKNETGWVALNDGLPLTSLYNLFKYHFCLKSVPAMEVLEFMSRRTGNSTEKAELIRLASDFNAYNAWRQDCHGIVHLFKQFPSLQVDSADLASRLPILQPRFYSIASSLDHLKKSSGKTGSTCLDLLIHVVEYPGPHGAKKRGFCSNFLQNLKVGDEIACYLRTAENFRLPEPKSDVPLICIATGSGIAPIRSFWQQKILEFEENSQTSQIHLFFGCRDQSADFFREETDPMEGKIMTRHSAYSRATDIPKEYVQDLLRKNGQNIFSALILKQARIYVCGQVSMASEVNAELVRIISAFGKLETDRSAAILNKLKDEGKYCEDIFG